MKKRIEEFLREIECTDMSNEAARHYVLAKGIGLLALAVNEVDTTLGNALPMAGKGC